MPNFQAIIEMAGSPSLLDRVAACAAQEGVENPRQWVYDNAWKLVSHDTSWAADWQYAVDTASANVNPDTGKRDDVISETKILAVVQPLKPPAVE